LAITLKDENGRPSMLRHVLAAAFFLVALFFIYRSFYGMRIVEATESEDARDRVPAMAGK
jgi:K(+)-stimulated pyrophosphate-energized sodium pump